MASYLALSELILGWTQSVTFYVFPDDIIGNVSTVNRIDNEVIGKQVI